MATTFNVYRAMLNEAAIKINQKEAKRIYREMLDNLYVKDSNSWNGYGKMIDFAALPRAERRKLVTKFKKLMAFAQKWWDTQNDMELADISGGDASRVLDVIDKYGYAIHKLK